MAPAKENAVHLVTKILIVFGSLLAILLSALAIPFGSNADALRRSIDVERAAASAANAALSDERTKWQTELSAAQQRTSASSSELQQLKSEIATLQNGRAKLTADLNEALLRAERESASSRGKDQIVQTNNALLEALNKEVTEFRKNQLDLVKRETELLERLSELESTNTVLEQNVRALQEQLAEAKLSVERATASAASGSGSTTLAARPATTMGGLESQGPLVTARVRRTVRAESGEDLAFISSGSGAGLRVGQRLHIVRDGKFVASLVLTAVDVNEAAGRVDKLGRTIDVMSDDIVLSRVN
jgi:hypothetical protein